MRLTPEQTSQLIGKLNELWGPIQPCPVCHTQGWIINDAVFELREFNQGNLVIGGQSQVYPVIAATCQHCGNTIFFNAIILGLVTPTPPNQGGRQP